MEQFNVITEISFKITDEGKILKADRTKVLKRDNASSYKEAIKIAKINIEGLSSEIIASIDYQLSGMQHKKMQSI